MKTTLYLPDALHRRAKTEASAAGMTLTDFFRRALETALAKRMEKKGAYRFAPPTVRLGRLRIDVSSRKAWMDRLD